LQRNRTEASDLLLLFDFPPPTFLLFVARINLEDFCDRELVPKRIGAET
jgi:hypothetical protein